jgi:hypothetical protein
MRIRWRIVLPVLALFAFGAESYLSLRMNQQLGATPRRYYWWSSIRLDTDPSNNNPKVPTPCKSGDENCRWGPNFIWIDPGYLTKSLALLALPAFALGAISVSGLAHLGINEVWSFIVLMPLFILAWFYFVGWFIDRWVRKRRERTA